VTILRNMLEVRASVEDPRFPLTHKRLLDWFGGQKTKSGVSVDTTGAIGRSIAVYRALTLVSGAIGALPLLAFRAGEARTPFRSAFLEDPHWDLPPMELWETVLMHLLGWGNAYGEKVRDGAGLVRYLDPIPPAAVTVHREARTATNPTGKVFEVAYKNGTKKAFTATAGDGGSGGILHVPGPGYDGLKGLSPIGVAREGIGLALGAEEYGARLFGDGTLQTIALTTDQSLDETKAKALKKRWKETMTGLAHAHEPAVLDSGLKIAQLSIAPEDAQFLETRMYQDGQIAMLYGIPPHLLAMTEKSTSWGTGIEQQNIGLVVYTLTPWMTRLEQRVSKECLTRPVKAQFDTDFLLRGDEKTRSEAARNWVEAGIKNVDTVRRRENMPPRQGGELYMIPNRVQLLDEEGQPRQAGERIASLMERIEAVGALIRAGFDPTSSLSAVDLPPIVHTGALPVTVQADDDEPAPDPLTDTVPAVPLVASSNAAADHQEVRS
jgi:HK97 family phage portal protein